MSMGKTITSIYAWIATEADGSEGIPAHSMRIDGHEFLMLMVGADLDRINSLTEQARTVMLRTGARMRLCRFQLADEIDEL